MNPSEDVDQIRVDLAAAYRLSDMYGFNEGVFNHLTVMKPDGSGFLTQPIGMHWSEVTASSLLEVDLDGAVTGDGHLEKSTFYIHLPMHLQVRSARCVFHTHMPFASTLTRLADPRLLTIGQTELRFARNIAYDGGYTGLVYDMEEGQRLAALLDRGKRVLMLANHGVIVIGKNVAETFDRLYYLEQACRAQVYAMWTGRELRQIPDDVIDHTLTQFRDSPLYGGKTGAELHFDALKRILARRNPGFED